MRNLIWLIVAIVIAGGAYLLYSTSASADTVQRPTAAELCAIPKSPKMPGTEQGDVRYLSGVLVHCGGEPRFCPMPETQGSVNLTSYIRACNATS